MRFAIYQKIWLLFGNYFPNLFFLSGSLARKRAWSRRHALKPAIIIACLSLHISFHFGVRQDQKLFLIQTLDDRLGELFRFHQPVNSRYAAIRPGHGGAHGLGTEGKYFYSLIAVGDGDIFGQPHGGMLGDAIRRRPNLVEETYGRGRDRSAPPRAIIAGRTTLHVLYGTSR